MLRSGYLFLYNAVQWAGWFSILVNRMTTLDDTRLTASGAEALYLFQGLAILEIVHSLVGLVRASVFTTFIQVLSRVQLIAVHYLVPEAQSSAGVLPMVLAWGLVEVVRYLYLALNLFQMAPRWLLWARYSLFYVLYPLGVYGEMKVLFDSLPSLYQSRILSIQLPNKWNFSFSFASYVVVLLYVIYLPGLYMQYTHMMKQRHKALSHVQDVKKSA
jgi:very-long-chain (3R)-3-hydroxyacyl-CoA dehydratase